MEHRLNSRCCPCFHAGMLPPSTPPHVRRGGEIRIRYIGGTVRAHTFVLNMASERVDSCPLVPLLASHVAVRTYDSGAGSTAHHGQLASSSSERGVMARCPMLRVQFPPAFPESGREAHAMFPAFQQSAAVR
jgi:hypothetical protein